MTTNQSRRLHRREQMDFTGKKHAAFANLTLAQLQRRERLNADRGIQTSPALREEIESREAATEGLGFIQIAGSDTLARVARGELDLNALARYELACRGLDRDGRWVGFEQAARIAKGGVR